MAEADTMIAERISPYLSPFLLILWILSIVAGRRRTYGKSVFILIPAALVISLLRLNHISIAGYILSANPVFSIGSFALLLSLVSKRILGREILSGYSMFIFALWNVILSLILFLSALNIIGIDIYRHGYGFSVLYIITALLTIVLFVLRNPLALIFLACLASFQIGLLPSGNLFDYLTDGPLFLLSCGILVIHCVKKISFPAMIDRT